MTIEFWTGRPEFEHAHEMLARRQVVELLRRQFAPGDDLVAAVFNFSCGEDLDLAVFKQDGIIAVEIKECSAPIRGGENGEWLILKEGTATATMKGGGRRANPFHQAKDYRFALMRYLEQHRAKFLPAQKVGQVSFEHVSAIGSGRLISSLSNNAQVN